MRRQDEFAVQAAIIFRLKNQHVAFQHPTVRPRRCVIGTATEWIRNRQCTLRHLVSSIFAAAICSICYPIENTVVVETPRMGSKVKLAIWHRGDILLGDGYAVGAHKRRANLHLCRGWRAYGYLLCRGGCTAATSC